MINPFESIEARLSNIEELLLDLKHPAPKVEAEQVDFLDVNGAAEFLKLTVPTVYSKVSRGELPVMKQGKKLYFDRDELANYVKEGRRITNREAEQKAGEHLK